MFPFIRKRLELKIIVSVALVIACMIGVYTYIDLGHMRTDTIRTSERTLGALASAVKGTVIASMKKGHHELVKNILDVMPDTHVDGAAYKAEVLRQRVRQQEFPGGAEPVFSTISIGVAAYVTGFPHDLIKAADRALYQAKNAGRNTVVVSRRDEVEV